MQTALQQRELRGVGVRVRSVQHGGKEATLKRLTTSRFSATLPQVDLKWLLTEVAFLSV